MEGRWDYIQRLRKLYPNAECVPFMYSILLTDQTQAFKYFFNSKPEVCVYVFLIFNLQANLFKVFFCQIL